MTTHTDDPTTTQALRRSTTVMRMLAEQRINFEVVTARDQFLRTSASERYPVNLTTIARYIVHFRLPGVSNLREAVTLDDALACVQQNIIDRMPLGCPVGVLDLDEARMLPLTCEVSIEPPATLRFQLR